AYGLDGNGNAVPGANVVFAIPAAVTAVNPVTGASLQTGPAKLSVPTDALGVATLALISKARGAYEVTAALGGAAITAGSPALAVFTNADPGASRSEFAIPTADTVKVVRKEFHTPTVTVRDASGNLYVDGSVAVTFRWRTVGASVWEGGKTVHSVEGVACWTDWTVNKAGAYEVEAFLPTGQVGSIQSASFKAGPAVASASEFTSSVGARVLNDGAAAHFAQVVLRDAAVAGNPVPGADVEFKVTGGAKLKVSGATPSQALSVKSSLAGVARVEVVDDVSGGETVTITALVGGDPVGTADLEFGPDAPDAIRSSWTVEPTTTVSPAHPAVLANGADSWTATVTVRDRIGQAVSGAAVSFDLPAAVNLSWSGASRTDAAGRLSVTLTSNRAGSYDLRPLLGAEPVSPGVKTISFEAGAVEPLLSNLEGPLESAVADGQATLVIRAHVLDATSNPVAGVRVAFAIPAGLTVVGGVAGATEHEVLVDGLTGLAELEVASRQAAVYQITAQAKGPRMSGWVAIEKGSPALAEFVAGPVDTTVSRVSRTPAGPLTAGVADGYEVLVELVDQFGNPVKKAQTPVQYLFFLGGDPSEPEAFCRGAGDQNTQRRSALTDASGQARVPFTAAKAGQWRGCAFYAGDRIVSGSPVELFFEPAAASAATSALEVSENAALADGTSVHYAKVMVTDQYANPIGGAVVDFAIDPGVDSIEGPAVHGGTATSAQIRTCDLAKKDQAAPYCEVGGVFQAGLAMVEFSSREPGDFPVSASLAGEAAQGSPKKVSFTAGIADAAKANWTLDPDTSDPDIGQTVAVPATGTAEHSYKLDLWVRSGSNLLVPGARVRLTGLPPAVAGGAAVEARTGDAASGRIGQYSWQLNSSLAGAFTGAVEVFTAEG
ncbi:MAG: Ig-like domain-containing protein, partial [Bifidobacteriaceae bacterium]|nr:Ig-like domain-containing protein [Bifidobacteriaceae bacterium]